MLRRLNGLLRGGRKEPEASTPPAPAIPEPSGEPLRWEGVGDGVQPPDPEGREWMTLERCPVCGYREVNVVCPWNKLLMLRHAPDQESARYDYGVCRGCGIVCAMRRPFGSRYRFLLEHFGEVTAKRGEGEDITNPVLNPYPLTDRDREELRRRAARGVFVSDHLGVDKNEHLAGLMRDRFESSGHVDLLGSLLAPQHARVLEIRPKAGGLLDGLRRNWGADVYAMPIWESQQFLLREVYGIPTSDLIDFDRFQIPFDGPFDLIICQHMLTHVLRPRDFFAELRRVLKPGGHLYLHNEPDDEEFLGGGQSMIATLNPLHMQAFDQASLMRGLTANGFETTFITHRQYSHLCLARVTDPRPVKMDRETRTRRTRRYRKAYGAAMLRLNVQVRSRVAAEWQEIAARAVARGSAEIDRNGRVRAVGSNLTGSAKQPKI